MNGQMPADDWTGGLRKALRFEGLIHMVGVGNPIRSDDRVGLEIASRLRSKIVPPSRAKVHSASEVPERLLSRLASTTLDRVIIFDAVEASMKPGAIVCRRLSDTKYGYFATHNVPLKLIPGLGTRLGDFYLVGVQPESLEVGEEITSPVNGAANLVVDFVAKMVSGER